MSTHWGYHCQTCDESSGIDWNHGDDQLALIAQNWPVIAPAYDLLRSGAIWRLDLKVICDDGADPLGFLKDHNGHVVVLRSEYGDIRSIEVSDATPAT